MSGLWAKIKRLLCFGGEGEEEEEESASLFGDLPPEYDDLLALGGEAQEEFPPAYEGQPPPPYEAPLAPAPPGLELFDEELEEDTLAWEQRG
ncbi:hypothetical protein LTR37_003415 [Vermiconidia calcicola]|uniref:Uncharacterized protein n=1 Tax=Vermiconidia calcicola TaxID=1690605 RepID=A0ACC3NQ69_9PEZI|nr:hypothetical protein LTR37_003415 [Vermiconidia calcicola]